MECAHVTGTSPPAGPRSASPPPNAPHPDAANVRTVRRRLLLILLVGIAPIVASYTLFWLGGRSQQVNYGTLIATPAPPITGRALNGAPFALASLERQWVMLVAAPASCPSACERKLYAARQARTMQNKDRDRVVRVWLVTDAGAPDAALLAQHPDLVVVHVDPTQLAALPARGDAIYLVDPRGNVVLAWPADPDINALARDLSRLLRASQIG
jgi:cytochrome oxidase Cu insertion factor (SCO1/SenC/PrrC family)